MAFVFNPFTGNLDIVRSDAELDGLYLRLDTVNDPLTGTLGGEGFDFTGNGQIDGNLTVGDSTVDDSLIRLFSADVLKYQVGWDESASAFVISEDVIGTTDIIKIENGSDFKHVTAMGGIPDPITATSEGVAASLDTLNTEVTTNDDNDLDDVTLADGFVGQIKNIYCVASFAGDTWKITPATMLGGTQITFGDNSVGTGCTLVFSANGWSIVGNNGGTIS